MTRRRWALTAVAACAAAAAIGLGVVYANGDDHRYSAEIRRTAYGIPHVLAKDYESLGYGYGYAFARDSLCVLADRVVTLRGERSRYFGPTADDDDPFADEESATSNLTSDVYYRGVRQSGVLQRLLAQAAALGPTDQLRQLVDGYVAGYNRYLHDTGVAHVPDPTCRGKAWVRPITALDVWSNVYDLNGLNGATMLKKEIVSAQPPGAGAHPPVDAPASRGPGGDGPPSTGSNGWALGRDTTRAHDGMLLANPHFPWAGYARFYQVQLTIPGVLDVTGASVSGTPVIEIGHTKGVAWTHTTSTARRFTAFQLRLVPGKPTSYLVDGRPEKMSRQLVTVTVRGPGGKLATVDRTLYGSRYGPVLATGWTSTAAFAVRDVNADNLRSMNEWLAMGRAQTVAELRRAQDTYQGIPWVNTLAADSRGTAYFADASVVPHVTDARARRCIDTPEGKALYPDTFVLDGSRSDCNWGTDPDAVRPGIFAPSHLPQLTRTDYVANSNDSPWLTNPSAPITGYPAISGDNRAERSLRTRLGLDMIARRLAGTDGLGPAGFTLPTLQATMLGDRIYSADLARSDVIAMCRAHPVLTAVDGTRVDVRAACNALASWNGRAGTGGPGEKLWLAFFREFGWRVPLGWRVPFDSAHPLTTPRGIDGSNRDVQREFAEAVRSLRSNDAARVAARWAGITLPGCPGERGCFDVIEATDSSGQLVGTPPNQTGPPDQTGPRPRPQPQQIAPPPGSEDRRPDNKPPSIFGTSFVMAVELTPHGPRARTLLTYSESADPTSPHHTDQTVLFSQKRWVTERFTEAEIEADPHLQTTTLHN
jgi:acyl-homoserine-lactone acylase